jgi:hypothetical protein
MAPRWGYRGEYRGAFHTRWVAGSLKLRQSVGLKDNGPEEDNSMWVLGLRGGVLLDGAGCDGEDRAAAAVGGADSVGAGGAWA